MPALQRHRVAQSPRLASSSFAHVIGSSRWPNLACHLAAGRALVSDKTRFSSERRDPHDLLHRGAAAGAGNSTSSSRKVRHNTALHSYSLLPRQFASDPTVSPTASCAYCQGHADQAPLCKAVGLTRDWSVPGSLIGMSHAQRSAGVSTTTTTSQRSVGHTCAG
jgi:hypothetical protein